MIPRLALALLGLALASMAFPSSAVAQPAVSGTCPTASCLPPSYPPNITNNYTIDHRKPTSARSNSRRDPRLSSTAIQNRLR